VLKVPHPLLNIIRIKAHKAVSGGLITISDQFSEWGGGVDNIYFDNGDVWNRIELESMAGSTII
jgi:hypothetical protein